MSHTLIKHEAGLRVVAVEDASGTIVETLREGGTVVRRSNGIPAAAPLFTGSETEAAAVLDGLAGAMGAKPAAQIPYFSTVAHRAERTASVRAPNAMVAAVSSLALSVLGVGGYIAYRDLHQPAPRQLQVAEAGEWRQPADFPYRDTNVPDPVAPPATVARGPVVPAGTSPGGKPPVVALPSTVAAPASPATPAAVEAKASDGNVTEAKADSGRPLKGAGIGLAKQEYAGLTKDNTYGSQTPPTQVPPGSSKVTLAAPSTQPATMASPAPASAPKAETPAKPVAAATPAKPETTANALASKVEAVRQETEAQQAEARKTVTEHGADKSAEDMDKLKAVLATLERGDKVSMAVVSQLPHEIAQKLREAGVVASDEDEAILAKANGGPDYRIVRLPMDAMDRLRDKDGVPTVPAANSWAATGGNVRIPLPGGGEIKTAEDLSKAFHLQP